MANLAQKIYSLKKELRTGKKINSGRPLSDDDRAAKNARLQELETAKEEKRSHTFDH